MREIIDQVNQLGFFPDSIEPDGKMRRFKRTPQDKHKDAWGICYENYTQTGEKFHFYVGGDWREPGLEIKVSSKKNLTKIDRKVIDAQIEETKRKVEQETLALREKCIQECGKIWEEGQAFTETEYTQRKKISGKFNVKTKFTEAGRMLLVPVTDFEQKLIGLQKIYPNGKKYFHPGTAKRGAFHLIGENINGDVYICEGFATGATIHMATGKPVVVAFDAGNLVPVAKGIRQKYRDTRIIICGDDDKETEGNPGKTMAEEAAKAAYGFYVLPPDLKPGLTDFNDLHVTQGLDSVKKVFETTQGEKHYLKPLGFHGDKFFYISSQSKDLISMTAGGHTKPALFKLMPLEYWESVYEGKRGTKWDQAISDLISDCQSVGKFQPERVRGVGVWEDASELVINLGDSLWQSGKIVGLDEIKTKYIYKAGTRVNEPKKEGLNNQECQELINVAAKLSWKKDEAVFLVLGFCALARFCGALQWSPHLWITGGFGTGKSTIMERFIRPLLGDISLYFLGNTTEAGIRQTIGHDARPIVFDEFETTDKTTDLRVKAILDLMRQASSESQARIVKGSADGSAIDYRARFCAAVSSIRVNLTNDADRSRFAVLELEKGDPNAWEGIKKSFDLITPEFSDRLFSRMVGMWPVIKLNQLQLQNAIGKIFDQRTGQQYGTLLAGYAALKWDRVLTDAEIGTLIGCLDAQERQHLVKETDERDCLSHFLSSKLRIQILDKIYEETLGELIQKARQSVGGSTTLLALANYGIRVQLEKEEHLEEGVYIANKHAELAKVFHHTKWQSGWRNSLARLKGAIYPQNPIRFTPLTKSRAVLIPFNVLEDENP